jgi:diadenosine tetraphosphate (Ap4A) HIT family hydrolase
LSSAEGQGFVEMAGVADRALRKAFACERVNFLLLMHFDRQVHFHLVPRYTRMVTMFGEEWSDGGWPGFPSKMAPGEGQVGEELLMSIFNALRGSI